MVISVGTLIVFLGYVVWASFLCDIIFPPISCTGEGVVLKKWYKPASKTTDLIDTTGGFGMFAHSSRTIPESWTARVQIEGKTHDLYISKELYDALSVGESVNVDYCEYQRFPNEIFIRSISKAAA